MPEVLYLQLDNVNTNKSKDLMAYLSLLIEKGIFKKIKINFLLVGHTHENIDQLFSRFSVALRQRDALTVQALMKVAQCSFTPSPTCEEVLAVRDWSKWFKGKRISDDRFHDISFNHAFRIKSVDNETVLHTKQYGGGHSGYRIWRSDAVRVLPSIPEDVPDTCDLKPLDSRDYFSLCELQRKLKEKISLSYVGEIKEFWDRQVVFQQRVSSGLESVQLTTNWPDPCSYVAPRGKCLLDLIPLLHSGMSLQCC